MDNDLRRLQDEWDDAAARGVVHKLRWVYRQNRREEPGLGFALMLAGVALIVAWVVLL